ncbi:glutamine--tRNA ligase [Aspergillus mulundensis]|uniref:glutamine--tRNA ligase n=1 Tax=Aspergillus mulundensis TaxID=1810919 RepID=A0A3D8R915_9EURO|nr:Uncharacterized protein DSM5745_08063 [Aspergillus mulundensis]RDW70552.1 Uncharacterized protein DSM5745_08063 [Aspergillus mulundensis]
MALDSKENTNDPDTIFKTGLLAEIHTENPAPNPVTRFPPEPNGVLHLGHAKAIAINFGFAAYHGGICYLRYDDTNPANEEERYVTAIADMVKWLGFEPAMVTSSSDYFERLYEMAEELIRRDGARSSADDIMVENEIAQQRGSGKGGPRYACRHRNRPVAESLREFRAMRDGKYAPQEALLRLKQDLESGNPQMWDLTAYRVIDVDGKVEGSTRSECDRDGKWRIYPTYDFAHCLVDSLEGITHSLCTMEFELSRVSYDWLCERLGVYRPMQREYARLNLSGTVLSKRKTQALISAGHVHDWDDPRLYTLIALKRRGVPPGAILSFVNGLGVSKATTTIPIQRFEQSVRRYLERSVPRLMLILDPVPVVIENLDDEYVEMVEVPFSREDGFGVHFVPFTRTVYVDRDDFREAGSIDFFRLATGQSVGLMRVPYPVTATGFEKDPCTGLVTLIRARYDKPTDGKTFKKPKAYIHWVAECPSLNSPLKATVRTYNPLFTVDNPDSHPQGFLSVVRPHSENVYPSALVEVGLKEIIRSAPWPKSHPGHPLGGPAQETGATLAFDMPETVRFQGPRVGYFCLDRDSSDGGIVLNRIVTLKEDARK